MWTRMEELRQISAGEEYVHKLEALITAIENHQGAPARKELREHLDILEAHLSGEEFSQAAPTVCAKIKALIPVGLAWSLSPLHMLACVLGAWVVLFGAGAFFVMIHLLYPSHPVNINLHAYDFINELCSQIICLIFTLGALANHPQRIVWTIQLFKNNKAYFYKFFPFHKMHPKRTILILFLLHTNCIAQYVIQWVLFNWSFQDPKGDNPRPMWLIGVFLPVAMGCGIGGQSYHEYLKKKHSCITLDGGPEADEARRCSLLHSNNSDTPPHHPDADGENGQDIVKAIPPNELNEDMHGATTINSQL